MAFLWIIITLCFACPVVESAIQEYPVALWRIGEFDQKRDDLKEQRDYAHDPFYVVGFSTPQNDWPARHTGPLDLWAGGRHGPCFSSRDDRRLKP